MTLRIAIQPDFVVHANGKEQSYSEIWKSRIEERGHEAVMVDVDSADFYPSVRSCNGFMWRPRPSRIERDKAMSVLNVVEQGLGLPVFPCARTRWHFEDKVVQNEMFQALDVPHPSTWIFRDEPSALAFVRSASFPKVIKLASGVQSRNVMLLQSREHAESIIRALFRRGMHRLPRTTDKRYHELLRRTRRALSALEGRNPDLPDHRDYFHHGYVLLQDFVPNNAHDTRIAIIKDRIFGFRRLVRDNDFRASGSGRIQWSPDLIDERMIRIALELNRTLSPQTIALDFVTDAEGAPLVLELTMSYASWILNEAPGYWKGAAKTASQNELEWVDASSESVESMLVDDYIDAVESSLSHRSTTL